MSRSVNMPCEHVAVCPSCRERVYRCDEDRCCPCGADIIVCADLYSAELLLDLLPRPEDDVGSEDALLTALGVDLEFLKGDTTYASSGIALSGLPYSEDARPKNRAQRRAGRS